MATHSKTRRAVQRLRRLARRRREAELKLARQSGTENRAAPPRASSTPTTILIVGALSYLPVLALGPLVEQLAMR
jgi:hypothetical protein